jgi:hypothetical protein
MQFLDPLPAGGKVAIWYPGGEFSTNDLDICTAFGNGTAFVRNDGLGGVEIYRDADWRGLAPESVLIIQDVGPLSMTATTYLVLFRFAGSPT